MPFRDSASAVRLSLSIGLYVAAALCAGLAWMHASSVGAVAFLCGGEQAHCWACYAAPLLAAAGMAILAAPVRKPVAARAPCCAHD